MTTKHTPGPWRVDPRGVGTPWNIGTDDQDIALAAQLIGDSLKQERRSANARLISAAPDLLAALKDLMDGEGDVHDKVVAARAAIAKAEGRW